MRSPRFLWGSSRQLHLPLSIRLDHQHLILHLRDYEQISEPESYRQSISNAGIFGLMTPTLHPKRLIFMLCQNHETPM